MKKHIILSFFVLAMIIKSYGQTNASTQLVVVIADEKTWMTDNNSITLLDSLSKTLTYINPHWVDNISSMKAPEATSKYGDAGKNGAAIYTLSSGTLIKMKEELRRKFK